jgi:hypothetical protein
MGVRYFFIKKNRRRTKNRGGRYGGRSPGYNLNITDGFTN